MIDEVLRSDRDLAPLVADCPGVRVPGVVSGAELAFRALIGQQVSVAGAATTAARITRRYGRQLDRPDLPGHEEDSRRPDRLFPEPAALAEADPETLPMPRARGRSLVRLATELAEGRIDLSPGADREEARTRLLAVPGIGPWTAGYIAMRALGDPDVLLAEDLVIRRELQRRGVEPSGRSSWAPWRSYATMRLWQASRWELAA
jgi:AraC family transcriptional regulator of adaptative response / DNA-3-methyladenine glycosylase II